MGIITAVAIISILVVKRKRKTQKGKLHMCTNSTTIHIHYMCIYNKFVENCYNSYCSGMNCKLLLLT